MKDQFENLDLKTVLQMLLLDIREEAVEEMDVTWTGGPNLAMRIVGMIDAFQNGIRAGAVRQDPAKEK